MVEELQAQKASGQRFVDVFAKDKGFVSDSTKNYHAKTSRGADAQIDGHEYCVGNHRFAHELGVCSPEIDAALDKIEANAQSVAAFMPLN